MATFLVTACGLPLNQLTPKERKADMEWAFTVLHHNYAPTELKKTNFGVELSQLESDCLTMAESDMDNQAFLALFQRCIHSLKDAHIGGRQMNNGLLPEYARVAHLGFTTMRTKSMVDGQKMDALRIVSPLKGSDNPGSPLIPGDIIIQVNGRSVADYLRDEVVPYLDAGQEETNLTAASFRFGLRTSVDMSLPEDEDIELVVARESMVFSIVLPWIREDLLDFQLKQNPPEENPESPQQLPVPHPLASGKPDFLSTDDPHLSGIVNAKLGSPTPPIKNPLAYNFLGYQEIKQLLDLVQNPLLFAANRLQLIGLTGYRLAKFNPVMQSLFNGELDQGGRVQETLQKRDLPHASKVNELMADPLFVAKAVTTQEGATYAYVQISNFPAEDKYLSEWFRMINAIEDKGIKALIIDLVDNGGGSLVHGLRMLNMLRKKPLEFPSLQVRLNNNWLNTFKSQAAFADNDYKKAIAAKVLRQMEDDQQTGKTLSRPFSVTVMDPFFLQNPSIGLADDVKIAVLVNELCVSMCDIFASVVQENELGTLVGQRTMGGGGNVVQHGLSPISKMGLALTESLMITSGGQYIEDQGVTPDISIDMVEDRAQGFSQALRIAFDQVMGDQNRP
jgi:C-terminal processing protease CtpA/Prc